MLLAVMMCFSLLPVSAFAEGDELTADLTAVEETEEQTAVEEPEEQSADLTPETADVETEDAPADLTTETAVEEPEEQPAEDAVYPTAEYEEGVEHGYIAPDGTEIPEDEVWSGGAELLGVYDTDYPVASDFSIAESKQTLSPGDTIHFTVKVTDNDGIEKVYGTLSSKKAENRYIAFTQSDEDQTIFTGEYTFKDSDPTGEYFLYSLMARDTYGFYTGYSRYNGRNSSMLPDYVKLYNPNVEPDTDLSDITSVAVTEAGQTITAGKDSFHATFSLPEDTESLDSVYASIYSSAGYSYNFSVYNNNLSYDFDASTKAVTVTCTPGTDIVNGDYYLGYINVYANNYNVFYYWRPTDSSAAELNFTVAGGKGPGNGPTVSDVKCEENNLTVTDGETVHFSARFTSNVEISSATMYLSPFNASEDTQGESHYTQSNITIALTYNASTDLYEGSYTMQDDDVYGAYEINEISVKDANGKYTYFYSYAYNFNQIFLFAESKSESIKRLDKAMDLAWNKNGKGSISLTLPADNQGSFRVSFYNADTGEYITSVSYSGYTYTATFSSNEFTYIVAVDDLPSGNYYFTVTINGDGVSYYDSETATSGTYKYTRPSKKLATPGTPVWTGIGSGGYEQAKCTYGSTTNVSKFLYEVYFAEELSDTPEEIYWSDAGTNSVFTLWDYWIQTYGSGYYYLRVRAISGNIDSYCSSDWSEMSEAYALTDAVSDVVSELDEVETIGKTADEIRQQVQDIGTDNLLTALTASSSAVESLKEIEEDTGIATSVSSTVSSFDDSLVSFTGAALNDLNGATSVTLNVDPPEKEHTVPSRYNNTLAISFSMNLDNAADQENLTVPVVVELPVPNTINPSYLVILHYPADGGEPETVLPYIYTSGGITYARIVLTSFSDFVMTQEYEPLTWDLSSNGTLTISGIGPMEDYAAGEAPWYLSRAKIKEVVIGDGISSIGANAFYGCTALVGTVIPANVTSIGYMAFGKCSKLTSVMFKGCPAIADGAFTSVKVTAYYSASDGWNESNMLSYGGTLTWKLWAGDEDYTGDTATVRAELDHDYIMAEAGDTLKLTAAVYTGEDGYISSPISWKAVDAEGNESGVVNIESTTDNTGSYTATLSAAAKGTAYIVFETEACYPTFNKNGTYASNVYETISATCRIDVTEADPEITANLPATKATVELYKTSYTRFNVLLLTDDLSTNPVESSGISSNGAELNSAENTAWTIESARFADETVNSYFTLNPVDDRTLEIVPTEKAVVMGAKLASSFKSKVIVTVDGEDYTCITTDGKNTEQVMALTVKKTVPSIKAAAVKLNSYLDSDTAQLTFTGGTVTQISEDTSKNTAKTTAVPSWLQGDYGYVDYDGMTVTIKYSGMKSASGKLYLNALVDGYVTTVPVVVSVSASQTAPKLTFKTSASSLVSGIGDSITATGTVTPNVYNNTDDSGNRIYPVSIEKITEGKNVYYPDDDGNFTQLSFMVSEYSADIYVSAPNNASDGKDHTYKVFATIGPEGRQKEFSFTVKVLAPYKGTARVNKLTVKSSGTIDTAIKGSSITLTPTLSNYSNTYGIGYRFEFYKTTTKGNTIPEGLDPLENVFSGVDLIDYVKNKCVHYSLITMADDAVLESGYYYKVRVICYSKSNVDEELASAVINLNTKSSDPAKLKPSVTIKSSDYIDVLRPGTSAVIITPTFKNWCSYDYTLDNAKKDVKIIRTSDKKDVTECFRFMVARNYNTSIRYGYGILMDSSYTGDIKISHNDKFTVEFTPTVQYNGADLALKATCSITVKQGTVKLTATPTAATMYAKDRYSTATVVINKSDYNLNDIREVKLDAASDKLFDLVDLGDGQYMLKYDNSCIPAGIKAGQTKTVKLSVYLEGNNPANGKTTISPNATLSVKVSIK